MNTNLIVIQHFATPLGQMLAGATDNGLCLLEFSDCTTLAAELKNLQRLLKANMCYGENDRTCQTEQQITQYFSGKLRTFNIPLCHPGTPFQQSVWQTLQTVPYGQTISYQEEAIRLGNPKAVRAVATANSTNRISIIIPCHRVIGKDGSLTGYGGGLERKRCLLEHEQNHISNIQTETTETPPQK